MLYIKKESGTPLYEQLYAAFVKEILAGGFAPGERLPATRKLAEELSVGRNTVDRAYQQLVVEGYVRSRMGSGFLVNEIPPEINPVSGKEEEVWPLTGGGEAVCGKAAGAWPLTGDKEMVGREAAEAQAACADGSNIVGRANTAGGTAVTNAADRAAAANIANAADTAAKAAIGTNAAGDSNAAKAATGITAASRAAATDIAATASSRAAAVNAANTADTAASAAGGDASYFDFDYGSIDNSMFPYRQWRKCFHNALNLVEASTVQQYPCQMGELPLRREIARYLRRSRGVDCRPDQIIVTCGQQHSMEMIANMFQDGAKRMAMEDPGSDWIRVVFLNHRYHMRYIPVEGDGISVDQVMQMSLDLLFITPSYQFPTGAVLSIAKRRRLLEWAQKTNAYIIEDDYDSELRYYTNPIPSLQSLDRYQRVIYTGTFSKALSPAVRLAYIVLPRSLMERYNAYYENYSSQAPVLIQMMMAEFMASGNFERNINRLRTVYRKRQEALISAIKEVFGDKIVLYGGGAGVHLLLDVQTTLTERELIERAWQVGARIYEMNARYMSGPGMPGTQLLLGIPTVPAEELKGVMEKLKRAWDMG